MEQALIEGKQGQIHKPDLSLGGDHQKINTTPRERYVVNTKVHEVEAAVIVKTKLGTLTSQKLYHQPASQDGQIIISKQGNKSSQVWDCGSSLYDSFELNSFNRQLDSAIKASSRTNSMPHLPESHAPAPPPIPEDLPVITTLTKHQTLPKKVSKLSKSFKKIMKSVLGSSTTNVSTDKKSQFSKTMSSEKNQKDSFYVYDGSKSVRVLSKIPKIQESNELGKLQLDASAPVVRRAASERYGSLLPSRVFLGNQDFKCQ